MGEFGAAERHAAVCATRRRIGVIDEVYRLLEDRRGGQEQGKLCGAGAPDIGCGAISQLAPALG